MFKKILITITIYIFGVNSCFIKNYVDNSKGLFSYNGNVYDMSNFIHPKGVNINKLIGNDLSDFVNSKKLSFHFSKNKFYSDLKNILVGEICDNSTNIPVTNYTTTTTNIPVTNYTTTTTNMPVTNYKTTTFTNIPISDTNTTTKMNTQFSTIYIEPVTTISSETTTDESPFIDHSIINKPNIILILSSLLAVYIL
jgi:hypothetical protein